MYFVIIYKSLLLFIKQGTTDLKKIPTIAEYYSFWSDIYANFITKFATTILKLNQLNMKTVFLVFSFLQGISLLPKLVKNKLSRNL
jgi:hypothetical protein